MIPVGLLFLSAALLLVVAMVIPDAWAMVSQWLSRGRSENVRFDHRVVGVKRRAR